jgi:hypothetical protein
VDRQNLLTQARMMRGDERRQQLGQDGALNFPWSTSQQWQI